jgi:hypothetical protein
MARRAEGVPFTPFVEKVVTDNWSAVSGRTFVIMVLGLSQYKTMSS